MQNLAFGLNSAPHEVQLPPLCFRGSNAGSGVGSVPGSLNPLGAVPITEGGAPTGLSGPPTRGPAFIPGITPGCPIPGINPGDCVPCSDTL